MDGLIKTFNELMETVRRYGDIAALIEEQNKSLSEIAEKLENIGGALWLL